MSTSYYIWYRVAGDPAAARMAVDALLRDVLAEAGVAGRLLVRRDDPRTWMEVFENITDVARFEHAMAEGIRRHDLARFAEKQVRHAEPFLPA
ncbi:MAG: DUF4936 family protein [Burkholderiales bacterium]|nr:DUF4936 family protein [Burkholderiales bacterium]